jgi:hypothetical protein
MPNLHDVTVENNVIGIFKYADHVTQNLKIGMKLTSCVICMPQTTEGVHFNVFIINRHFHKISVKCFVLQFPCSQKIGQQD